MRPLQASSQASRILGYMVSGKAITPLQAFSRYGCLRLGARIHELKRRGHRIDTDMVRKGGKLVAKYSLSFRNGKAPVRGP